MKKLTIVLFIFLFISCAGQKKEPEKIVDFSGVWARENNDVVSKIFINQQGKEVKFTWTQEAKDGSWKIECNDAGECDKVQNGEKVEHYSFSVGISEDGRKLSVNWLARNLKTGSIVPFTDEIEMSSGGKEIISKPIAFDKSGKKVYPGEEYRFHKSE